MDDTPAILLRRLADAFDQGQNFQLTDVDMKVGLQHGERTLRFSLVFMSLSQREKFEIQFEEYRA